MKTTARNNASVSARLESGLLELQLTFTTGQLDALLHYVELLQHWNKRMNLIGSIGDEALITRHILDCAAVVPWLHGERVADIGTGAGLPGIVIAILSPKRHYSLVDSRDKRSHFLRHVASTLELGQVEVVCCRVEQYPVTVKFDTLVSRAFSQLDRFITLSRHMCADKGRWLAMKGRVSDEELRQMQRLFSKNACLDLKRSKRKDSNINGENSLPVVERLNIPLLDEERHLVIVNNGDCQYSSQ